MELPKLLGEGLNFSRCIGELAVWMAQDALIAVDDNIQELPDE